MDGWMTLEVSGYAYLPSLDSDTRHCSEHFNISYGDVGYTCLCVVPP